jgi:NAD(P)-dependent dehydrogenase (short-subunit alcohol dehydrogenase family)
MNEKGAARVALVTGVGREEGLGFEICRQLAGLGMTVLLTARRAGQARALAAKLVGAGDVRAFGLDVADDAGVEACAGLVAREFGALDVLVNNASSSFDPETPSLEVTLGGARAGLEVDLLGPWRTMRAFAPLLRAGGRGRVVNVSSGAGSFEGPGGLRALDAPYAGALVTYAVAKAALNALTLKFAAALREAGVLVNAVSPGFVATHPDLAALGARPVAEGAAGVVWAATLPPGGPTGGFFLDGRPADW